MPWAGRSCGCEPGRNRSEIGRDRVASDTAGTAPAFLADHHAERLAGVPMSAFGRPIWTLDQALAWVALRDRELVDLITDDEGVVSFERLFGDRAILTIDKAKRALLEALQTDRLHASGIRNREGDCEPIPAVHWRGLDLYRGNSEVDFDAGPKDLNRAGTRWYDLQFERREVLATFEVGGAIASTLPSVTAALSGASTPGVRTGTISSTLPTLTTAGLRPSDQAARPLRRHGPVPAAGKAENRADRPRSYRHPPTWRCGSALPPGKRTRAGTGEAVGTAMKNSAQGRPRVRGSPI